MRIGGNVADEEQDKKRGWEETKNGRGRRNRTEAKTKRIRGLKENTELEKSKGDTKKWEVSRRVCGQVQQKVLISRFTGD